ncbi:MAG: hypothetical protein AAGG81_07440 [Chlamydiota bacterium]
MATFAKMSPISINTHDQLPLIQAFAADKEGVYEDHIEEKSSSNLKGCLGVLDKKSIFFRSESLDTPQKTIQFSRITKFAQSKVRSKGEPFRCTCCQLGVIDQEADLIMNQHLYLVKLNKRKVDPVPFAHILLPTDPLYYIPLRERVFSTSLHDLEVISHQVSYEGLITYAYWLSQEYEKVIPTFNYSATEEYEVEKCLCDLINQARSDVLKSVKVDVVNYLGKIDQLMGGTKGEFSSFTHRQQIIELEKRLIQCREELKLYIDNILKQLFNVQIAIEKIAVAHPELEQVYYSTVLLKSMMIHWDHPFRQWSEKSLLHSLLDQQLGVITLFNSYQNDNRSLFSFAVRYALLSLCNLRTKSDLTEIVLNWYGYVRRLHRHHIENGNYAPRDKRLNLVYQLRQRILQVFLSISGSEYSVEGNQVNREFLTLLPVYSQTKSGKPLQILEVDPQTFEAVDFKEDLDDLLFALGRC